MTGTPNDVGRAPESQRSLKIAIGAGIGVLGVALLIVVATLPALLDTGGTTDLDTAPATDPAGARRIQATLFYVSEDGTELLPVTRDVPYGETPAEQARHLVVAQLADPPDGHVSPIPAGVSVRGLFLGARGEAYVDLGAEATTTHPGGALGEALAVFAIVNAITANLPDIRAVQILVDGQEVDSLAGHIDLRQPIGHASAWIRKGQ